MGSGTVAEVAIKWGRQYLGVELNPMYQGELAANRIAKEQSKMALFAGVNQ
jgi:DNA modification methylase